MKKITLFLVFCTCLLISCSKEELQIENPDYATSEMIDIKEVKNNPSILNSVKFQKIKAVNKKTNKNGIFYFQKKKSTTSKVTETRGLQYSGGDCAIWGSIYTDDVSGVSVFVPASAATQLLMNVCGLSNVAKIINHK